MALRVSAELRRGQVVNLGIGIPTLVADHLPADRGVILHSENGILNYGSHSDEDFGNPYIINARGEKISSRPGTAIISHNDAFAIARSGLLDVAVLGALQVSGKGDLANWSIPVKGIGSPGGAVDIAAQARTLIVMTRHTTNEGMPKILNECTYPLTVSGRVNLIITDLAVIEVTHQGLALKEVAPGWSVEDIQHLTEAPLRVPSGIQEMRFLDPIASPQVHKVFRNPKEAVADVFDGAVILMDGFGGLGGMAHCLMLALRDQGARDLTIVSNTAGIARVSSFGRAPSPDLQPVDHSVLIETGQVRKFIVSFPVSPSPSRTSAFEAAYRRGEVDLEIVPQGTLAEKLRAGGAGVAAFYTPTGVGTFVDQGKDVRTIDGKKYVLERSIRGDFSLIRAHKSDTLGNLVYRGSSRNFNSVMATASDVTIVESDEIVDPGDLLPNSIITPGVYINRIVHRPPDFSAFQPLTKEPKIA